MKKELLQFAVKRALEPSTWASVAALVALYKPDLAHQIVTVAAALGALLPEGAGETIADAVSVK